MGLPIGAGIYLLKDRLQSKPKLERPELQSELPISRQVAPGMNDLAVSTRKKAPKKKKDTGKKKTKASGWFDALMSRGPTAAATFAAGATVPAGYAAAEHVMNNKRKTLLENLIARREAELTKALTQEQELAMRGKTACHKALEKIASTLYDGFAALGDARVKQAATRLGDIPGMLAETFQTGRPEVAKIAPLIKVLAAGAGAYGLYSGLQAQYENDPKRQKKKRVEEALAERLTTRRGVGPISECGG